MLQPSVQITSSPLKGEMRGDHDYRYESLFYTPSIFPWFTLEMQWITRKGKHEGVTLPQVLKGLYYNYS